MKYILFISSLLFISPFNESSYQEILEKHLRSNRQEKLYLHLDKKYYGAGDIMWFKSYLVDATNHQPSNLSKTIYVDLINEAGTIVESLLLYATKGTSSGSFKLPDTLDSGNYQIRAYTNWMRNFPEEFFFSKNFRVINSNQEQEVIVKQQSLHQVDFLPEGGDLITGIGSKVAIKAYDSLGRGMMITGMIENSNGKEIVPFKTNKNGLGLIFIVPQAGENYVAKLDNNSSFNLPAIKKKGAIINVTNKFENDHILIAVNSKGVSLENGTLVAHQRGKHLFSVNKVKKGPFIAKVSKTDLKKEGIIHLTFFNEDGIPFTERLVYTNIPKIGSDKIQISSTKSSYAKRSKVEVEIQVQDSIHSASLVINPKDEQHFNDHDVSIVTELMLTSDLKGYIESPGSYFEGTKAAYKAMDLLMLSSGWSRFNWEDLLAKKEKEKLFHIEKGVSIEGQIVDYYKKDKPREGIIKINTLTNFSENNIGKTSENGKFIIDDNIFRDSTKIILQARGFKGKKRKEDEYVSIILKEYQKPALTEWYNAKNENKSFKEKVNKQSQIRKAYNFEDVTYLDEILVKADKIAELNKIVTPYANPRSRIVIDSLNFPPTVDVTFLLSTVSGVQVLGDQINPVVLIRGGAGSINASNSPLFLLDGVPVDYSSLQYLNTNDIEFIDVLKGAEAAIFGSRANGGAISVYTKRGGGSKNEQREPKGLLAFTHPGYHQAKEFYSPNYKVSEEGHIVPDFRSTLFWEPEIRFENGTAIVEFYSSDQSGTFDIRMEGLLKSGTPFVSKSSFSIKK